MGDQFAFFFLTFFTIGGSDKVVVCLMCFQPAADDNVVPLLKEKVKKNRVNFEAKAQVNLLIGAPAYFLAQALPCEGGRRGAGRGASHSGRQAGRQAGSQASMKEVLEMKWGWK